jgi:hypothetical protein
MPIPAGAGQQVAGAVKHDFRGFGLVTFEGCDPLPGGYVPDVDMKRMCVGRTMKLSSGGGCWSYEPRKAVMPPPSAAAP